MFFAASSEGTVEPLSRLGVASFKDIILRIGIVINQLLSIVINHSLNQDNVGKRKYQNFRLQLCNLNQKYVLTICKKKPYEN